MEKSARENGLGDGIAAQTAALRRLLDTAYTPLPNEQGHIVQIVASKDSIDESECPKDQSIVTVSEAGIFYWYRPYSEPGAPAFAKSRLRGLCAFMRVVVWPRIANGSVTARFALEKHLDENDQAALDAYNELLEEQKRLQLLDIDNLLLGKATLQRLYQAARESNLEVIEHFVSEPSEVPAGVRHEDIQSLADALKSNRAEKSKWLKRLLIFQILTAAGEQLPSSQVFEWQSAEYRDCTERVFNAFEKLRVVSTRYFARQFERFALSDNVIETKRSLFNNTPEETIEDYRQRILEFVSQVVAGRSAV
jgi:hypothetical protein